MGLLDDLLAGLAGSQATGQPRNQPLDRTPAQSSGVNMSQIMIALLPIVLAMLRNRGTAQPQALPGQRADSGGGGLGDLLGSILGGGSGGGMGGLGGLLDQLQRAGFGDQANSWVGTGQNQPLPPNALEQIFGQGGLAEIARRAGLSEADTSRGLSQLLPEVVDHVTPEGQVPNGDSLTASVDALTRRYGLS